MRFRDKVSQEMAVKGFNGQKLARASGVSDSEISRILRGDPQRGPFPGLVNAHRLARALGVSLDYLADDSMEHDPSKPVEPFSREERELLDLANHLGQRHARRVLETVGDLGYEAGIRRLLGMEVGKPMVEVGESGGRPAASATPSTSHSSSSMGRANTA